MRDYYQLCTSVMEKILISEKVTGVFDAVMVHISLNLEVFFSFCKLPTVFLLNIVFSHSKRIYSNTNRT